MSQPATVEGLGPVYARLYGFINAHAPATEGDAEVAPESVQDIYITQFPFVIGRQAPDDGSQHLVIPNGKVSKKHAQLDLVELEGSGSGSAGGATATPSYHIKLTCYSKNGIDVNRVKLAEHDSVVLESMAALRIGPYHGFLCFPKKFKTRTRSSVPYAVLLDTIYKQHEGELQYFTVADIVKHAMAYYGADALGSDASVRASVLRVLKQPGSGFETVDSVPDEVKAAGVAAHGKGASSSLWWRKSQGGSGAGGSGSGGVAADRMED